MRTVTARIGRALLGLLWGCLALAFAPACSTEAYCFADCTLDPDSGLGNAGDGSTQSNGGTTNINTDGGFQLPGGRGGATGVGDAGSSSCEDADLDTDPHNCGSCGNECAISGARPKCVAGKCQIDDCSFGRYDINGKLSDGCEYACVPGVSAKEICNDLDDNCDGSIDEGFDLEHDSKNCGACGNECSVPNGAASCNGGACKLTSCAVGFYDVNQIDADGCEYECTPSNGGVEICDGLDNNCDGVADDGNPGGGQACDTYCPDGVCKGICTSGTQVCVAGSTICIPGVGPTLETCDGRDEDCAGVTDNGFDLSSDPRNCGACGNNCTEQFSHAVGTCVNSTCTLLVCDDGYKDYDATTPGCEKCAVWPTTAESCNGADDDCDGIVDNPLAIDAKKPPISFCKYKAGTPCATVQVKCMATLGWQCLYDNSVELDATGKVSATESRCDGVDNNCDGYIDEAFQTLGQSCDNGAQGVCKDLGKIACDPADSKKTLCNLALGPDPAVGAPFAFETCNGLDDNCNGQVDENSEDMVRITRNSLDFYIDRYEASRPDAKPASVGLDESHVCSNSNVLPWTGATYLGAKAACEVSGRRLCSAAEMLEACIGVAQSPFPYGSAYDGQKCNGLDYAANVGVPVKTGSLTSCVSQQTAASTANGVFDLSGNVNEWTSTVVGNTGAPLNLPIQSLQGGSYLSPGNGLICAFNLDRISTNAVLPSLGFRCCKNAP